MSRIIDADALMKDIRDSLNQMTDIGIAIDGDWLWAKLNDAIDNAPTIESEQQWIPCSERLPEDYTDVLVWFEYFRYGVYNRLYQTYGIGDYSSEYDSWMINHESGWNKLRVFAWMPLPEPFKGEQE